MPGLSNRDMMRLPPDERAKAFAKRLKGKKGISRNRVIRWCRSFAETEEGKRQLLHHVYSHDENIAFQALSLVYAYAYGRPGSIDNRSDENDIKTDWRKYQGESGKEILAQEFAAEVEQFKQHLRLKFGPAIARTIDAPKNP